MAFGESTIAAEVIAGTELSGTTAVITGASGGIGLETKTAAHAADPDDARRLWTVSEELIGETLPA